MATNTSAMRYLIIEARVVFTYIKQVFTAELILQHFDLKCYIRIETNVSNYTISKVISQLNFD